ncbi:hypothetical protein [Streptomyces subrutilus]|uniref:hypothetical protein n=1 Tax=Streptomyces subrutilus TaxID=36818 RepID=UPI0033D98F6C
MSDLVWVPQPCTLPTEERPLRVAEWDALFAERLTSLARPEPLWLRLDLAGGPGVEEQVRELAARESDCCAFFAFTTTCDENLIGLDIAVDPEHKAVLEALGARIAAARQSR